MGNVKLLSKTLKPILAYSLLILGLSIPAYFLIINHIWIAELDEHHRVLSKKLETQLNAMQISEKEFAQALQLWNGIGIYLTPAQLPISQPDSFFISRRHDKDHGEFEQFRGLATYITVHQKPYHLLVETNMEEIEETIGAIAAVTLVFFLLLLGGILWLNKKLSVQIWQPFNDTLFQLKQFQLDSQKNIAFHRSNIIEFEELHEVLNKLIANNISVYQQQKQFVENASHELQTPLALLKSKIDLFEQTNELTNEQAQIIENINLSLSRVSRINKNLLLLSKIENKQFADSEKINLNELIAQQVELFAEHLESKNISLEKQLIHSHFLTANKSLVEIMISNLIVNAIRHNQENGAVKITSNQHGFTIANTGTAPLQEENLFKRFMTTSSQTPSSGLGLAIVKEISMRYDWRVTYYFKESLHLFLVQF